ncbi:DUF6351 family protein [Streptomyces sp. NPDC002666]
MASTCGSSIFGKARRPLDNTGSQYGLQALSDGNHRHGPVHRPEPAGARDAADIRCA